MSELTQDTRRILTYAADTLAEGPLEESEREEMCESFRELAGRWKANADQHAIHLEIQAAADHMVMLGQEVGALRPYTTAQVTAPDPKTGDGWKIVTMTNGPARRVAPSFLDSTDWPEDATDLLSAIRATAGAFRAVSLGHRRYSAS